jgi:gliding motility-associated-like protein
LTINPSIPIEVKINAPSNEISPGDSLLLTAQLGDSSNLASISWQGTGLAPCKGCMNIQVNPSKSTVYQALVESTNGCKSKAEFQVFVVQENQVYAPTAFSPNGDNKNDRFFLAGKKNLKVTYFRIFDRWGTLVFEATNGALNDASIGWDGTYAGKVVPPGAFVWIAELELNSKTLQSYSGEAILLK